MIKVVSAMTQSVDFSKSVNHISELLYKEIEQNMWTFEELKNTFLTKCPIEIFFLSLKTLEVSGRIEKRLLMGSVFYTVKLKKK